MGNTNFESGKMGEFICAVALMKLGESVEIVNLDRVDLIVNKQERGLIRVQVKSSHFKTREANRKRSYQFFPSFGGKKLPLTRKECDAVAFVALDIERVRFVAVKQLNFHVTKRFYKDHFQIEDLEQDTWSNTLKGVQ